MLAILEAPKTVYLASEEMARLLGCYMTNTSYDSIFVDFSYRIACILLSEKEPFSERFILAK